MSDLITITLVTDSDRYRTEKPIEAPSDDPHLIWPHVLNLAATHRLGDSAYRAEVTLADTDEPLYELRCL